MVKTLIKYELVINRALRSALMYDTAEQQINEFISFLGRQIGLSPLLTLVSLYAGFRLYGILGMLLLPVAVILCRQIYELMEPPAEKQA